MGAKQRKVRISPVPSWSWKIRGVTFLAVFGGIWAVLDPLFTLWNEPSLLEQLGGWRYLFLVVLAAAIVGSAEFVRRIYCRGRQTFVSFIVTITTSGMQYLVEAPLDMNTGAFTDQFLGKITRDAPPRTALAAWYLYTLSLRIDDRVLDRGKTLRENGLKDGTETTILGKIKREEEPMLLK